MVKCRYRQPNLITIDQTQSTQTVRHPPLRRINAARLVQLAVPQRAQRPAIDVPKFDPSQSDSNTQFNRISTGGHLPSATNQIWFTRRYNMYMVSLAGGQRAKIGIVTAESQQSNVTCSHPVDSTQEVSESFSGPDRETAA